MKAEKMKVAVLSGGISHEREVSLRSGVAVAKALRSVGVKVLEVDVKERGVKGWGGAGGIGGGANTVYGKWIGGECVGLR